jgi:DNA-binding LacI/PurR family transcriptional regulator
MDLVRRLQASGLHALPIDAQQFQGTSAEVSRILAHRPVALVMQDTNDQVRDFYLKHHGRFPRKIVWSGTCTREYSDASVVRTDYRQGVHLAARHLIEQGHRRIVFFHYVWRYGQETHPGSAHEQAMRGYEEALAEAGLAGGKRYLFVAENQREVLRQIRALFREPADTRPDGLITHMDFWAAKAIHEIRRLGLRVPRDVAVVGHNNTPWTEWAEVPLSSVDIQQIEIARIIVENLTGHYHPGEVMTVEPKLVVRASSASGDSPHQGPEHEVSTMEVAM